MGLSQLLNLKFSIIKLFEILVVIFTLMQLASGVYNYIGKQQVALTTNNPIASPVFLLIGKEVVLIFIFCTSVIFFLKNPNIRSTHIAYLLIVISSIIISFASFDMVQIYSIFRFNIGLVVFLLLVHVGYQPSDIFVRFFIFVVCIQLGFQFWQILNWHMYVVFIGGIPVRFPGFFNTPTGAGVFSFSTLLILLKYRRLKNVALLSIILSGSFSVYVATLCYFTFKNGRILAIVMIPFFVMGLAYFLESMRPGIFAESLGPRLAILVDLFHYSHLLPIGSGKGTISYEMLGGSAPISADGLVAQLVINYGLIWFILFMCVLFIYTIHLVREKNYQSLALVFSFFPLALTAPLFEIFPAIFVLGIVTMQNLASKSVTS